MKLKLFAILTLSLVFGYSLLLSTHVANAQEADMISPISGPVTGPVTFAGFKLQGKVTLKVLGRWFHSFWKIIPAENVTVTAKNRQTGEVTQTQTDSDGNYLFTLPEAKYRVSVTDDGTWFFPPFRFVNLNQDKDNANFRGVKFEHGSSNHHHDDENDQEDND